ncbi:hypothetical protein ACM0P6_05010 [Komagataeibacter sucrofermentans]|uniref:Uncharacterized protein n=1 Tax=Komagataeibacter sucrofermentans TaxID=1053551 RepID=A0A318QN98_9PROT|nr:hypothetical protein [Komagataeibacter sucrofermentans]PYD79414.1 hypothetical protein CFR77_06640 [Komagataeibacter sucrofermentans]GBQ53567.1 hypothetical protein AA15973_3019 [Komagataeibacter sucrofermentans DSM 15973]
MNRSIPQSKLLGNQHLTQIVDYLIEIGDEDTADQFARHGGTGQSMSWPWGTQVWGYTGMLIGYLAPDATGSEIEIANGMTLAPAPELRGSRVKITLERFWVNKYPGLGEHTVLCEFTGKNQIPGETEELRFALTVKARDGSGAGITGTPIFLGVSVGANGISFEGTTVNVRDSVDDGVLKALGSGPFRDGLSLLTTAQPALKPFVGLAGSLVSAVAERNKNRPIYSFKLGLDFENGSTSACLRHGSFIVI